MALEIVQGLIACAISSVFFGSMFVPLKKFDIGDGMLFFPCYSFFEYNKYFNKLVELFSRILIIYFKF